MAVGNSDDRSVVYFGGGEIEVYSFTYKEGSAQADEYGTDLHLEIVIYDPLTMEEELHLVIPVDHAEGFAEMIKDSIDEARTLTRK